MGMERKGHHGREDLIGEHKWGDAGQVILILFFLAAWICDSFFLHYSDFLSKYIPLYIRIPVSHTFFIFAAYFAKNGLKIIFGEVRDKPTIVRKKVFGLVRHPIYLGAILFYLGMVLITFSLIATFVWFIIIIFYIIISKHEEKLLLEHFGGEYQKYMDEVPMLFPKLKRK